MLQPPHIIHLQLDRIRLAAHEQMPLPEYVTKPLIGQFTTLSDAILTGLLNIDPEIFRKQLATARRLGAAWLGEDAQHKIIGISATTSLIRNGNVLAKNLIVPQDFLRFDKRLADHFVIGAFVRGQAVDGKLAY